MHARGFSLLEMLLVLAIIAFAGLLAAAAMTGGLDGMRLRSASGEIAAQLRFTRAQAIATGQRQVAAPAQVLGVCGTQRRRDDFAIAYAAAGMRQAPHADHVEHREGEIQR